MSKGYRAEREPDSFEKAAGVVTLAITTVAASAMTTGFWFCFDDLLATVTGEAWVGSIGFWQMFSALTFTSAVTRRIVFKYVEK
jgi:hypothetical protein